MTTVSTAPHQHRFDQAAITYDGVAHVQRDMAARLAEWLPQERTGDALEFAAGTGLFTRHLLPWDGCLEVTDISPEMVRLGRENFPEVPWSVRDAGRRGRPQSLDWILSCSFLQWASAVEEVIDAWRAQLLHGGQVLCGVYTAGTLAELRALPGGEPPLRWRTAEEYESLFRRAGLHVARCDVIERTYQYRSAFDLFRRLHRLGATGRPRLSVAQLRHLMADYESAYPHPRGGVRATWEFCRIAAKSASD